MEEKIHDDVINNKPRMAICYDFDKTLSPDDMQTFTLIPSFGVDKVAFWAESTELAKNNLMDNNLAWMVSRWKDADAERTDGGIRQLEGAERK